MEHVQAELERIRVRLVNRPHPNEHAGLYAAQQALEWALDPSGFKAPYAMVTGIREASRDCCPTSRPEPFEHTDAPPTMS